jgi:hypothetical protein
VRFLLQAHLCTQEAIQEFSINELLACTSTATARWTFDQCGQQWSQFFILLINDIDERMQESSSSMKSKFNYLS